MDFSPVLISLKTAAMSIVFTFLLGILCARWVAFMKSPRAKMIIDGILTLPLVLPPTVLGFFLLLIFGVKRPIGHFILETFGVTIVFTWWATVIAAVVVAFPLMYRSARGAFEQVDRDLIYAGRTLGMKEGDIFRRVVIPNALPGIASGGVLAFARGLGEFGATIMLAGNIAGRTRTLPLAIYSDVAGGDMQSAYSYVAILCVFSFVIVVALNYFTLRNSRAERRAAR
ncbi:MAG: molybdate ABC transporter permease subunit [Eubacteriaceae bacterium]|nr:molybdate ABC transporter permease subunit [Eubacteriaceae bacterium]